jgi:putative addiction module component (TIGR02574 family)
LQVDIHLKVLCKASSRGPGQHQRYTSKTLESAQPRLRCRLQIHSNGEHPCTTRLPIWPDGASCCRSEERQQLVAELLVSLNEPAVSELDAAWSMEIAERLAAYDRGEVQALPADEVLARVHALAK